MKYLLATAFLLATAAQASAQVRPTGYISTFVGVFPHADRPVGPSGVVSPFRRTVDIRARAFAEQKLTPVDWMRVTLSGFAEGLVGRRSDRSVEDAIVRVQDASVELIGRRVDLLAGFTRVAWGRLDELQPTDVINPLDVSRFFFEGRSEARLPVALARARWFLTDDVTLEGVVVPVFRRGRFDQLDEPTSPFNLVSLPVEQVEPHRDLSGGARFSATTGRVDWSVSAFRGFEPFGAYVPRSAARSVAQVFSRFSMFGGDFETVRGRWGIRGEVAAFTEDTFQDVIGPVGGRSFDAGVGADLKAGDYRVSGTALFHRERYDRPIQSAEGFETGRTDLSLIASAERSFARETYSVRLFGVYATTEGSLFARSIATAKLRDNLALEGSIGWFFGDGRDLIGRFSDSDFVYARLKYYF